MRKNLGAMGMPDLHIHVQVKTPGGVILEDRWEKGHSWTRNAWCLFNGVMLECGGSGVAYPSVVNRPGKLGLLAVNGYVGNSTTGSAMTRGTSVPGLVGTGFHNNAENANYGIAVGTGVGEGFHPFNYMLYAQVAHGTGSGQLSHTAQSAPVLTYDSATRKFTNTITRVFNNNSGGQIDIKELGLLWNGWAFNTGTVYLLAHDILDTTVELPNTGQLTVTYAITSQEFTIDADEDAYFAPGTAGSGGYVIGVTKHPTYGLYDPRWVLIAAPVTGGQTTGKKFRTPAATVSETNTERGWLNSSALQAQGEASEIGVFMDAANAADLGGFDDWYVPSLYELVEICWPNRAAMPSGEEWLTDTYYWSSSNGDHYRARASNFNSSGTDSWIEQVTACNVRLVRRCHIKDFVPAE